MAEVRIRAEQRTEFGKGGARRTRRAGLVPAVSQPVRHAMLGDSSLASGVLTVVTLIITAASRQASAENESLPSNQFAYVADQGSGKILGYIVNSANGKLSPVAGSPFSTGKSGSTSVAVDPAGRFVYATNQFAGDNDISGFQIDGDTGRLTPIHGSPFKAGSGPTAVAEGSASTWPPSPCAWIAGKRERNSSKLSSTVRS